MSFQAMAPVSHIQIVKQLIHAVVICKSNSMRLLMQGLKFHFPARKKLSEIKGPLPSAAGLQLYFVFMVGDLQLVG